MDNYVRMQNSIQLISKMLDNSITIKFIWYPVEGMDRV